MPLSHLDTATAATSIGLGGVGGALSVIFGGQMPVSHKIGCVVSGFAIAAVIPPVVPIFWTDPPPQVYTIMGLFCGLVGMFIVKGVLAWGQRFQLKIPGIIDDRTGIDTKSDTEDKK